MTTKALRHKEREKDNQGAITDRNMAKPYLIL